MLFHIVDSRVTDENFATIAEAIRNAYWPEDRYKALYTMLPTWAVPPPENEMIRSVTKSLEKMVECISKDYLYAQFSIDPIGKFNEYLDIKFPFMDCFHQLFLKREYDCPYRDPQDETNNILSLYPDIEPNPKKKLYENYSKNYGNYNHFVNVVMATARIIRYFRVAGNLSALLDKAELSSEELCKVLLYENATTPNIPPSIRTFKLMLAAFYHDIGKTIVDHRHGMEGAFILADHTTRSLAQLNDIAKLYSPTYSLEREDLLEISTMLYYHDSFGTFGTGESSYMLLAEIIDRIKRGSLKYLGNADAQKKYCNRMLFDLWILNIADIVVSNQDKFKFQERWLKESTANDDIKTFFDCESGRSRIHDLKVAIKLLEKHNTGTHQDDTIELERIAQHEATSHCVERIKRLVCSSLQIAIGQFVEEKTATAFESKMLRGILSLLSSLAGTKPEFSSGAVHNIIFRSIESSSDSREFYKRFAWIVSMDYALGFFTKIARRAVEVVDDELTGKSVTGWIRARNAQEPAAYEPGDDEIRKSNALFFMDNYCATVVKIIAHLLFRGGSIDRPSRIEFEDARNRLIKNKIDKIIGMEGPYRQNNSIELILKTVFVY